ncbi:DUF3048 domain-containing protein [Candidatus Saccharibacteria bacterium]|nr:DUF3048 domain-containing protein [Candidatus Saccharibacteria bacterium]
MQSDIAPPTMGPNKKLNRQTMRSERLLGHSINDARRRLLGYKEIAGSDDLPSLEASATIHPILPIGQNTGKVGRKLGFWQNWSKRRKLVTSISSIILLVGGVGIGYVTFIQKSSAPDIEKVALKVQAEPPPKPKTVASPLSGVQVTPELATRPVTGIMIENSLDARPQSGLQDAGVVFEAIAEGGITRFMALFQDTTPGYIGPVRSLRPYYIDFAAPFDAGIAHVGGSPEALAQIRSGGKDLDQFFNAGSYWRVGSRRAPHNMYTSFERLDALNQKKGYISSKFVSWPRKEDKAVTVPTAKSIDIAISSVNYNSHYDYDAATNSYLRSEGGRPHIATNAEADPAGQQLRPKVVLVLIMPYSTAGKYSVYGTNGSGVMYVFQDGTATEGKWNKADRASQFTFTDLAGKPLALNAGQTWITPLAAASKVSYKP